MDEAQGLGDELLDASAGVEHEFNPALSAFSFDVVLERIADHAFACERTADESVQESCL